MSWLNDKGSIAILGTTQTAKSTAAKELHAETDRISIWINDADDEDRVPGVKGVYVYSRQTLLEALRDGETKINYQATDRQEAVVTIKETLWTLASRTKRNMRTQVIIDEAHNVAPQTPKENHPSRDAVRDLAREGQKRGIKTVLIVQDPVSMDKQALRQVTYVMMFRMSMFQEDSLKRFNLPWDRIKELDHDPEGPSEAIVIEDNGDVLEPGTTPKEKYAE